MSRVDPAGSSRDPRTSVRAKLGIGGQADLVVHIRHAPPGFDRALGDLGNAIRQATLLAPIDVVVAFHRSPTTLREDWPRLADAALPSGVVWIAWPDVVDEMPAAGGVLDAAQVRRLAPQGWADDKAIVIDLAGDGAGTAAAGPGAAGTAVSAVSAGAAVPAVTMRGERWQALRFVHRPPKLRPRDAAVARRRR